MHPAPSVIAFTTLSGAGFGLLFWLGLGLPAATGMAAFIWFAIAYGLAVGGLIASTFHLGHPERALKAFSQWRSSWLSREGVLAVAALIVMGLYAIGAIFAGQRIAVLGWLGAALSLGTVVCTAMIYAQLKTVPRWHTWLTPALFVAIALAGGALIGGLKIPALSLLSVAAVVQTGWWTRARQTDLAPASTLATATGLGAEGRIRSFAPPHTSPNYLMKEFMYDVARRHSRQVRLIALVLGYIAPALWLLPPFSHLFLIIAILLHLTGIMASRWLFFAEARHVVGIWYGR